MRLPEFVADTVNAHGDGLLAESVICTAHVRPSHRSVAARSFSTFARIRVSGGPPS